MRILLVEDETLLVWSLQQALTRAGFEVVAEYSGEGALVQLRTTSFDWVITDYRLPGISGREVVRHARRLQPKARILVISAYGTPQLVDEVLQMGASHFLAKPFSIDKLIELLRPPDTEPAEDNSATHGSATRSC
jgi:two-component system response regulator AtoC